MSTMDVQISGTGAVDLPVKIRSKYKLEGGDLMVLSDLDGAFFSFS